VGLVLIDTGFGMRDVLDPSRRLSRAYLTLMRPRLRTEVTAVRQVRRLGFDPTDVRHIIVTHLDCDRVGGLDDFPQATIHVHRDEVRAATAQVSRLDRMRYRGEQWSSRHRWRTYPDGGDTLFGFRGVRQLDGIPPEILMVPMPGHTLGHVGVAVRLARSWLMFAGDAYLSHDELDPVRPSCGAALRFYQWMMQRDRVARRENQRRLRDLANSGKPVTICSSHDHVSLDRLLPPGPETRISVSLSPFQEAQRAKHDVCIVHDGGGARLRWLRQSRGEV
jgi:glyoxylase-like metal-dependent hydrolase (beta-lactamase superfamily II)